MVQIRSSNSTCGYLSETKKDFNLKRHLHSHVHCSTICNSQAMEKPKCPLMDEWIKKMYVCVYRKKERKWSRLVMSNSLQPHWTGAHQVPLSMEFSSQEYWSGLSFPPPRNLAYPVIEPTSPVSPALAGGCFTTVPPRKPRLDYVTTEYTSNPNSHSFN